MISSNLKYLRKKLQQSQQQIADNLGIPRTTYSEYEKANTEPGIKLLKKMSDYFNCTLDALLNSDLRQEDLAYFKNDHYKVLATTMDLDGRFNIELVETKAEAGYINNLADPEFISDLPKIYFPLLRDGIYRAFQIHGDSMLPMESGTIVISKYLEHPGLIKDGKTYIVITHKEGVVFKRLTRLQEEHKMLAVSDNPLFKPYTIELEDIQEIWQYQAHIGFNDMKRTYDVMLEEKINDMSIKVNSIYDIVSRKD